MFHHFPNKNLSRRFHGYTQFLSPETGLPIFSLFISPLTNRTYVYCTLDLYEISPLLKKIGEASETNWSCLKYGLFLVRSERIARNRSDAINWIGRFWGDGARTKEEEEEREKKSMSVWSRFYFLLLELNSGMMTRQEITKKNGIRICHHFRLKKLKRGEILKKRINTWSMRVFVPIKKKIRSWAH